MKALFVELPAFERHRQDYLSDDSFRELQWMLMSNPEAGDMIEGTGGLRKIRFKDAKRNKGKRGGLRVIYYWWQKGVQFGCLPFTTKMKWTTLPQTKKSC